MSALGPAGHAFEPSAEACPAGPSSYDTADDAVFAALRQAARERMAAIKRAQLAAHAEEMASAKRPNAIDVSKSEQSKP